ncbi:MAG: aldehyde ferredoxin oxidoreductase family protein, partial [Promethearchaeota archaeon]
GLSAKITFDLLSEVDYNTLKVNPYSEINPLIFATGPVTGTVRPSSGRYSVTGISPLTKIWGEGTSGGTFCISLRNSGFDAIVITGKSKNPMYLYIHDEIIEFKSAKEIWGKDTYETQEIIKSELKNDKVKIATIGIAGENLVKYAAIINDEGRAVGRCGLGALMGSKNLKALAIHGSNRVESANVELSKKILKEAQEIVKKDFTKKVIFNLFNLYGTNLYLDIGMVIGDTPGYYFTETEFLAEKLTAKTLKELYPVFNYGCADCALQCGKKTIIQVDGKEIEVDGPEYESVAALGPLVGVFDPMTVILSNHKCNVYGFDTISGGVSISFLIFLVENNLGIDKINQFLEDINIEEIKWGNGELILKLIDKISKREGIGDVLAEGVRIMAEKFEVDPELAAHVKGLEMPMHDPRASFGQALSYMTCCVGANHEKCDWFNVEMGNPKYSNVRVLSKSREKIDRREKGVIALQNIRAIDDSAVNCNLRNPELDDIVGYINAATGFNYDLKSLLKVGDRINTIKRLINCKLGITKADDKLAGINTKVLKKGKIAGIKLDLEKNLERYYKDRGWNIDSGVPTQEKLDELGI